MQRLQLRHLLAEAVLGVTREEPELFAGRVGEVSVVSSIFARMHCVGAAGYSIDLEYDRQGLRGEFKRPAVQERAPTRRGSIRPDIIVHRRGDPAGNLLVVEFKLAADSQRDRAKVSALMRPAPEGHGYRFGATVVLRPTGGTPKWRWFDGPGDDPPLVDIVP